MTKADLIGLVAAKTELSKKDSEKEVSLVGFGSFEVKTRGPRKGINPRTKEEITIEASKLPAFKAGKALKDAVSK